ncbi:MAG: sigma-70 family RNA polymerase sigma factor [Planctomycetia bacterium]|nr:sigma-70 family RNA polymerase sigma factor [Planctomycetia bacterium]
MPAAPFGTVLRQLFGQPGALPVEEATDAALLARFAAERDEAAFAELVQRHGPLVRGVCRRVLRDADAADDAFLATFLVLARKAGLLDGRRPLGCWLYTVARNLALKHRLAAVRRQAHEQEAGVMRHVPSDTETEQREVAALLDAELSRLPEKYRAPLVLCHLQGLTHAAAAQQLGWPAGSLAKRLARGLELLRGRLAGRGLAVPASGLAVLLGEDASAAVSPALAAQLGRAAARFAAGEATAGLVSAAATGLAESAWPTLAVVRWKLAALLLGGVLLGAGFALAYRDEPAVADSTPVPQDRAEPAAAAEEDPRDQESRRRLARPFELKHGVDPNTHLRDAVDYIAETTKLSIRLDREAFAAAGVPAVEQCLVQLPRLHLPLATVLRLLLRQIEPRDGRVAGYRLEQGTVVIVPQFLENRASERFPAGLPERLFRPVRSERQPHDLTLGEAVEHFGKLYGQRLVLDRAAFAAVGEADAGLYPLAGRAPDLPAEPCLLEVLDRILWQTSGDRWKSYLRLRGDGIELTAAPHDSAAARQLAAHGAAVREYWEHWQGSPPLAERCRQRVDLEKGIDPKTALIDALEFLDDRYRLTIVVDEAAFAAAGFIHVREAPVQLAPQLAVPLDNVLRRVLDQVKHDSFTAVGIYRDGYLEVVPQLDTLHRQQPLSADQLHRLWVDLGQADGTRARLAIQTLSAAPRESLPFLKQRLRPPGPQERQLTERVCRLIADLDSEKFATRQQASDELVKLGFDALPLLRGRLMDQPSLEVRTRIEQVLERMGGFPEAELVVPVRAVRVLEAVGTPEARRLLETLAAGPPGAPPTLAARAALARLK